MTRFLTGRHYHLLYTFPPESWVDEEQTLNIWWKTSQTVDMVDFLKLATFLLAHPFIYVDKVVS